MKRTTKDEAGMSLIELMFATGILAGTLAAVFTSLVGISAIGTTNENRTRAAITLASVLEEINALPFSEAIKYAPPTALSVPGISHQVSVAMLLPSDGDEENTAAIPMAAGFDTTQALLRPNPARLRSTAEHPHCPRSRTV